MRKIMAVVIRFLLFCTVALPLALLMPAVAFAQVSTVTISPTQGPPGTTVTGSGTNWRAGDHMQISWDDGAILANTTVKSDDTFSAVFNAPSNATKGAHTIYFTDLDSRYFLVATFEVTAGGDDAIQKRIEELEQWILNHPGVFDWNVHNELRHLYSTKNPPDLRKAMEHSNVILQHSVMDEYILNILSGWQIGKDTPAARKNLQDTAQSYSDLRFLVAACSLEIGDLYKLEGNLEEAKSFYQKVAIDNSTDIAQYRLLAEEKLNALLTTHCQDAPFIFPVPSVDSSGKNSYIGWLYKVSTWCRNWRSEEACKDKDGKPIDWIDLSHYHSGLDFWVAEGTPVMAQATGYMSRAPVQMDNTNAYKIDIYYPSLGVETYINNVTNLKISFDANTNQGTPVYAGMPIGTAGSYEGHVHWSVGPKGYNDQTPIPDPTFNAIQLDPTSFLTPKGNLNNATGAQLHWESVPLSWWCNGK